MESQPLYTFSRSVLQATLLYIFWFLKRNVTHDYEGQVHLK